MKHLLKGEEPQLLTQGRAQIKQRASAVGDSWYDALDSEAKSAVKAQSLGEQGYLCPYTGLRIEEHTSHIEHMWPQAHCSAEEQTDYKNLIACYNGPDDPHPGFGAKQKGHWPPASERHLFVRPTDATCEGRFAYSSDGHVRPKNTDDVAAAETISRLVLSDEETLLFKWRKAALAPLLKFKRVDALRQRIAVLNDAKNGRLEPFFFPKQQYLQARLVQLEKVRRFAKPRKP